MKAVGPEATELMIDNPALGRQKSDIFVEEWNWKIDFGLLKEGHFLGPRINPTVYLFDFEYFFCKNVFCEICKIYIEKTMLASSRRVVFWQFLSALPWVFLENSFVLRPMLGNDLASTKTI